MALAYLAPFYVHMSTHLGSNLKNFGFPMYGLGDRIKMLRGKVSQGDFAIEFDIHRNTLSRWESGEREPDVTFLVHLADKKNIALEWLLTGAGPMMRGVEKFACDTQPSTSPSSDVPDKKVRHVGHESIQHIENINSDKEKTSDMSDFLGQQREKEIVPKTTDMSAVEGRNHLNLLFQKNRTTDVSAVLTSCPSDADNQNGRHVAHKKMQHHEKNDFYKNNMGDASPFLYLTEQNAAMQRELLEAVRQNGDLRVEIERQKARIAELERQLAEALKPQERPPVLGERSAAAG